MDRASDHDKPSKSFEIYLLMEEGADRFDVGAVLREILAGGHVRPLASDPARAVYGNLSTGVFFGLTLAPPVAALWESRRRSGGDEEGGEEPQDAQDAEASGAEEGYAEEGQDEFAGEEEYQEGEEGEEDEEEEEEPAHDLEMTPVVLAVSLLSPAFFAREALAFAERIARSAALHLSHPEPHGEDAEVVADAEAATGGEREAPGSPATLPEFFDGWDRSRRELVKSLIERKVAAIDAAPPVDPKKPVKDDAWDGIITRWDLEKAEAWWRYGEARARLQEELEHDGVRVPLLQAAKHEGRVKTLCDWDQGSPTVLPRTDLVLLRREKSQKGLFRTRRVVEEGLVSGERLWEILAGASERRREPLDILIFREAASPPQDVAAKLETLELAPLAGAKRTSLFGVIDFDPEVRKA